MEKFRLFIVVIFQVF